MDLAAAPVTSGGTVEVEVAGVDRGAARRAVDLDVISEGRYRQLNIDSPAPDIGA